MAAPTDLLTFYRVVNYTPTATSECAACLDPFTETDVICGHQAKDSKGNFLRNPVDLVHKKCLEDWVAKKESGKETCPICTGRIKPINPMQILAITPEDNPAPAPAAHPGAAEHPHPHGPVAPPAVFVDDRYPLPPPPPPPPPPFNPANAAISVSGRVLKWGMEQDWLHPANVGQSGLSRTVGKYFVRPLMRLIYAIAVGVLIAPFGGLYHLSAALYYTVAKKDHFAKEHLNAAAADFCAIVGLTLGSLFVYRSYWLGGENTLACTKMYYHHSHKGKQYADQALQTRL